MVDNSSGYYYTGTTRIASRLAGDVTDFHAASEQAEYGVQTIGLKGRQENDIKTAFDQFKLSHPAIWNVPRMAPPCNQGEEEDELCFCEFDHQCGTGPIYFFHSDHLGSSTFLTDGSGQPYQFFLNLPLGETMEEQFALAPNAWWKTPYLFKGKELDSRTSLYYYGARYYDPGLSVWLSVDPLAEDYAAWTPYNYTMQNPIRLVDPDGMGAKEAEDWYLPTGGSELEWANNIKTQENVDNVPGGGTYIGPSAYQVDNNGNRISYNEDGMKNDGVDLPEVTVTPSTGQFNLAKVVRSSTINVFGLNKYLQNGISNPYESAEAAATAMFNGLLLTSSASGVGGSISTLVKSSSLLEKAYWGSDALVTASDVLFNMVNDAGYKPLSNTSSFYSTISVVRDLKKGKSPMLHDVIGLGNSLQFHRDNKNKQK